MFSPKGAMDPVPNAGNDTRIPMIDLPVSKEELVGLLNKIDAVLVTHTHRDHWDAAAQEMIPKQLPIFCQATDVEKIKVDTINHCKVTRKVLSDYMTANSKKGIIAILDDGGRL